MKYQINKQIPLHALVSKSNGIGVFFDVISKKGGHLQDGYVTQRLYFEIYLGKEVMCWVVSLKNAEKK